MAGEGRVRGNRTKQQTKIFVAMLVFLILQQELSFDRQTCCYRQKVRFPYHVWRHPEGEICLPPHSTRTLVGRLQVVAGECQSHWKTSPTYTSLIYKLYFYVCVLLKLLRISAETHTNRGTIKEWYYMPETGQASVGGLFLGKFRTTFGIVYNNTSQKWNGFDWLICNFARVR